VAAGLDRAARILADAHDRYSAARDHDHDQHQHDQHDDHDDHDDHDESCARCLIAAGLAADATAAYYDARTGHLIS
jgi:hypothetical protein